MRGTATWRGERNPRGAALGELGVHAHDPCAAEMARQFAQQVREWDCGPQHGPWPDFTLYPADAEVAPPASGTIFTRRHVQIALAWP